MTACYYAAFRPDAMDIVTIYDRPPKRRASYTTNKDRILSDLLAEVDAGIMSVREADAAYGQRSRGKYGGRDRGRPRKWPTFADYLADRIRYATDPAVEQRLRELLTRAGRYATMKQQPATKRLNRLLANTGADRAAQLREWLAELVEPAGNAD